MQADKLKIDARRSKIIEILNRTGQVRVNDLARDLQTTVVTIRSDLDALERDGYLERIQGGALQTTLNYSIRNFLNKKRNNTDTKKRMAASTAKLIRDGDSILMNSGTTTYYIALELKKFKNLKIVTNSLNIALELGSTPTFSVILLGGEINSQDSFTYGNDVVEQLRRYKADRAILSIDGVTEESISTLHSEEVLVERTMIERAKEIIIVADSHKLEREGFLHVCSLSSIDKLVTVKEANPVFVRKMKEKNIKVLQG